MVSIEEIQAAYYMVAATGVLVAAGYYVMNLRNAERDRRKQLILQKLPPITREYYEWNLQIRHDDITEETWNKKYRLKPELESKVQYISNIYNIAGVLYEQGMMTLDDVATLYSPGWILTWYEKFRFYIDMIRPAYPKFMMPFEKLCTDLRKAYPDSLGENLRIRDETLKLMQLDSESETSTQ
jgi:hypothetical protein